MDIPQDIHIHLDGDSSGKGQDAEKDIVEEGEDYLSNTDTESGPDTPEHLDKEIKDLEEKLKTLKKQKNQTDTGIQ